ncbi:L-rhamnose mutarotase [bioreactor metagenome]|uniref:L-rhamnose mutarotase n=1 Tax=bioreactor metagenome TaxID=1076179 RepID=A0A645BTD5_9ZZZZ
MIRKGFLIQAQPGMEKEYERRHNPIWPELDAIMRAHGVLNFTTFLHEPTNQMFCYVEIEDEDKFNAMAKEPVCQRWWKYMTEALVCEAPDADKGKEESLREIFHM